MSYILQEQTKAGIRRNKSFSSLQGFNVALNAVDVEINDCFMPFGREQEITVGFVVLKHRLREDCRTPGVHEDIETSLIVGITIGIIGADRPLFAVVVAV